MRKTDVYEIGVLENRINSEEEGRPKETVAESVQKRNTYLKKLKK